MDFVQKCFSSTHSRQKIYSMITPAAIYYSTEMCILQADINTTTFSIVIALELYNIYQE